MMKIGIFDTQTSIFFTNKVSKILQICTKYEKKNSTVGGGVGERRHPQRVTQAKHKKKNILKKPKKNPGHAQKKNHSV